MPLLSPCPRAETLEQFLLGRTDEEGARDHETHVTDCTACQRVMAGLAGSDDFVGALSSHTQSSRRGIELSASGDDVPWELVDVLIPHLKRIPAQLQQTTHFSTGIQDTLSLRFQSTPAPAKGPGQPGDPAEKTRLGPYEIRGILGSGGMGTVLDAYDGRLKRSVAIKVVQSKLLAEPDMAERFVREAQAAAAVEHDNIVAIFGVETYDGAPCIIMPLLRGHSLNTRLTEAGGPLPLGELLRIGVETATGLAAAHARGLIHRDIKPANLWLESPTGRVKILDFGLALIRSDIACEAAEISGTPGFFSPEQARGLGVDPRTDLFSLGCVLYVMATGRTPFTGPVGLRALWTVLSPPPTPAAALNRTLPPELSDLIGSLLARKPADRPASAEIVRQALEAIARQPAEDHKRRLRRRWLMALTCAALLSGGAVGTWSILTMTPIATPVEVTLVGEVPDLSVVLRHEGQEQLVKLSASTTLPLAPGDYTLRPLTPSPGRTLVPERFQVLADKPLSVRVALVGEVASHAAHTQAVTGVGVVAGKESTTANSVGLDRTLVAWDLAHTGETRFVDLVHSARCLAVAPSGTEIATAGGNKFPPIELTIQRWQSGELVPIGLPLEGHTRLISALAYSPNGQQLASAAVDGVFVWNLASGEHVALPQAPPSSVLALAWSSDGKQLLTAGAAGSVAFWDPAAKDKTRSLVAGDTTLRAALLLPDGFAAAGDDGIVRVWTGNAPAPQELRGHEGAVLALAATPDGRLLLSGGADGTIRVWSLPRGQLLHILSGHTSAVQALAIVPDGRQAISGGADQTVRLWQLPFP